MAAKTPAKKSGYPRKEIPCQQGSDDDTAGRNYASVILSPDVGAFRVIHEATPDGLRENLDTPGILAVLKDHAAAVQGSDLSHAEAMLINQAEALQSLFVRLTERGLNQDTMSNLSGFLRLALRAQAQCRATLETLSAIKNPPILYAKQVNQTTGPQQIKNGSPAREHENEPTKLSADTRATLPAIGGDPALEAVGAIDRAANRRG